MANFNPNRRKFIQSAGAVLTLSALQAKGLTLVHARNNLRVGVIGAGWNGKSDLFKLIQVSDVNVVAVGDVDKKNLEEAGKINSQLEDANNRETIYGQKR